MGGNTGKIFCCRSFKNITFLEIVKYIFEIVSGVDEEKKIFIVAWVWHTMLQVIVPKLFEVCSVDGIIVADGANAVNTRTPELSTRDIAFSNSSLSVATLNPLSGHIEITSQYFPAYDLIMKVRMVVAASFLFLAMTKNFPHEYSNVS